MVCVELKSGALAAMAALERSACRLVILVWESCRARACWLSLEVSSAFVASEVERAWRALAASEVAFKRDA